MKKLKSNIKREQYISPGMNVLSLQSEGVLCDSVGGASINEWVEEDTGLDF
ncbi:MAG: hypothetical protein ACI3ZQ_04015 [Candidatus Cryptobacteroides sp.]